MTSLLPNEWWVHGRLLSRRRVGWGRALGRGIWQWWGIWFKCTSFLQFKMPSLLASIILMFCQCSTSAEPSSILGHFSCLNCVYLSWVNSPHPEVTLPCPRLYFESNFETRFSTNHPWLPLFSSDPFCTFVFQRVCIQCVPCWLTYYLIYIFNDGTLMFVFLI